MLSKSEIKKKNREEDTASLLDMFKNPAIGGTAAGAITGAVLFPILRHYPEFAEPTIMAIGLTGIGAGLLNLCLNAVPEASDSSGSRRAKRHKHIEPQLG